MRSPIIAFSIVAAAAVSPTLVAGAPTSTNKMVAVPSTPHLPVSVPMSRRRDLENRDSRGSKTHHKHKNYARQSPDSATAGGNAYSGSSSDVDGGDVFNVADTPDGVITNNPGSNTAGTGGDTFTGEAVGGNGGGFGPGGNAYSGFSGNSDGGDVDNLGTSNIDNIATSNTAGDAGTTTSGNAIGGDENQFQFNNDDFDFTKRDIDNDGGLAGAGGFSTSGLAEGGRGGDNGQGGNAYSGSVGNAEGGSINNGEIDVEEFHNRGPGFGSAPGAGVPGAAAPPPPPPPNAPPQRFGGGNAFSGNTGNDRGGSINSVAEDDQDIANIPGGTAGVGGQSFSGDAIGGDAA
ncbi:hypothetical protein EUX98_g2196 [Antrodiella citrinella]|uniref:Uncharacterized protein n=1 Tax=Antrodiella citrinella TaxID=2447956 RepID=A0A4S4MZL9_9APHY|nr:hypothetical protein EUX98_g2196 [Antrodiella citrinella]